MIYSIKTDITGETVLIDMSDGQKEAIDYFLSLSPRQQEAIGHFYNYFDLRQKFEVVPLTDSEILDIEEL